MKGFLYLTLNVYLISAIPSPVGNGLEVADDSLIVISLGSSNLYYLPAESVISVHCLIVLFEFPLKSTKFPLESGTPVDVVISTSS